MNYPFDNDIKKTVTDNLNSVHASDDLIAETLRRLQLEGLVSEDDKEIGEEKSLANKRGSIRARLMGLLTFVLLACTFVMCYLAF